jgi:hypothetical protein
VYAVLALSAELMNLAPYPLPQLVTKLTKAYQSKILINSLAVIIGQEKLSFKLSKSRSPVTRFDKEKYTCFETPSAKT